MSVLRTGVRLPATPPTDYSVGETPADQGSAKGPFFFVSNAIYVNDDGNIYNRGIDGVSQMHGIMINDIHPLAIQTVPDIDAANNRIGLRLRFNF